MESLKRDHDFLAEVIEQTSRELLRCGNDLKECRNGPTQNHDESCHPRGRQFENMPDLQQMPNTSFFSTSSVHKITGYDSSSDTNGDENTITVNELYTKLQGILPQRDPSEIAELTVSDGETSSGESDGEEEAKVNQVLEFNAMFSTFDLSHLCSHSDDGDVSSDEEEENEWPREDDLIFTEQFGEYFQKRIRCLTSSSDGSGYLGDSSGPSSLCDFEMESTILMRSVKRMQAMPSANGGKLYRNKQMKLVFDKLSSIINAGGFEAFKKHRDKIIQSRPGDADLMCILLYLEACTHLFKGNLRECERVVERAVELVPYTSNPSKVMVEIFSLKCWMYLKENKLNALECHLSDAAQIIAQDPMAVAGKAAGWLYVDEARRLIPLMTTNNLVRSYSIRDQAIQCLNKALEHFKYDDGKDGPFGYCFAQIKLSMLLLGCGELMQTTDLQPTEAELVDTTKRLREVENSTIGLPAILKLQYCMAMSDLHYRRRNLARALNYSEEAFKLTKGLNLPEETRCAKARRDFHRNLKAQSLEFSLQTAWGERKERFGRGNLKYISTSNSDFEITEDVFHRSYQKVKEQEVKVIRPSTQLSYFVRLWVVIVLLSASWLFSESI